MKLPANWHEPAPIDLRTVFATGFADVDEILQRRGFSDSESAAAWLTPDLPTMAAATVVPGLEQVLDCVQRAIQADARILVFGDYDCDGITSTAILYSALCFAAKDHRSIGWMLPNRKDGYGLRHVQLDRVRAFRPDLLILVDCGSNDVDTITILLNEGIHVAIIDHHQISVSLPDSVPLANPHCEKGLPSQVMTAAGLAWLTANRLEQRGLTICRNGEGHARYLDLAAIGTIADVAPLTGINRAIVGNGVDALRSTLRHGFRALAREARIDLQNIRADDIPFKVSSVLNSPGRIGNPDIVLRLILESHFDRASESAREVLAMHKARRKEGDLVLGSAVEQAQNFQDDRIMVISGDDWNPGVLGPVASKLVEQLKRPVVVLGGNGDVLTGSGRSVSGWNIAKSFQAVGEFVVHSGGHSAAAGLSVQRDVLETFRAAINAYEADVPYSDPVDELFIDAEVGGNGLGFGLVNALEQLGPFGKGNARPLYLWRNAHIMNLRFVGQGGSVAQMEIGNLDSSIGAVLFKDVERLGAPTSAQQFDVVIEPSISVWNGRSRAQAQLIAFQPSD